jgi:hypothetical protein
MEPELRQNGRAIRKVLSRVNASSCRDCDAEWDGPSAIGAGSNHAIGVDHRVIASYTATYEYSLNPNADDYLDRSAAKAKKPYRYDKKLDEL